MATKKAEENGIHIEIETFDIQMFTMKIVGDSPLISHAWSHKAKKMILDKQKKKANTGREVRRPMVDFAESLYWLTEKPDFDGMTDEQAADVLAEIIPKSKFGFPVTAFKSAAIDAGYQQGVLAKKATARGAFHIQDEFAVIDGIPTPREDMVRIGMGVADISFRAQFLNWSTELLIKYNARAISMEQIINLFMLGGFSNGVGDWRPAKDGSFGTFHVEPSTI